MQAAKITRKRGAPAEIPVIGFLPVDFIFVG
jgi:hypothetical protein